MTVHKLRVLVVDDIPSGLSKDLRWPNNFDRPPKMSSEFDAWFEFRWVATPQEACEYRNISWLIAQRDARTLGEDAWVPELLLIDYALTQDSRTVADRVNNQNDWIERLSPLPSLRRCAKKLSIEFPAKQEAPDFKAPPAGSEYWGCFIGGLLMNTFGDHPCAPLTITRADQATLKTQAVDAAFFEWLMAVQSTNLLRADGRTTSPPWRDVLPPAVAHLRRRMLVLAKTDIIRLSLEDLLSLAENRQHPVLAATSRYGRRTYPVPGLFMDQKDNPSEWAKQVLREAWWEATGASGSEGFNESIKQIRVALTISKDLWLAYDSDELDGVFEARLRLSELLVLFDGLGKMSALSREEQDELNGHCVTFGTTLDAESCTKSVWDIRECNSNNSVAVERWVVLFSIVRLLHRRHEALRRTHKLPQEVLPSDQLSLEKQIDVDDVHLALFPIAKNPPRLPYHTKDSKTRNNWQQFLSSRGINVKKLLQGKEFQPGERVVLRMFAETIKYDWSADENPQAANVLSSVQRAEHED